MPLTSYSRCPQYGGDVMHMSMLAVASSASTTFASPHMTRYVGLKLGVSAAGSIFVLEVRSSEFARSAIFLSALGAPPRCGPVPASPLSGDIGKRPRFEHCSNSAYLAAFR